MARSGIRLIAGLCALVLAGSSMPEPAAAQSGPAGQGTAGAPGVGPSGLPVPRFVSLKADRINMRTGPGTDYPTQWVFKRAGLPVEVIREFEGWRQVRDAEGTTGWVLAPLLSGRRTALVTPWELKGGRAAPQVAIKDDDNERAKEVAQVEAGVIANVRYCDGRWCEISIGDVRGYLEQRKLWGVYPNETVR